MFSARWAWSRVWCVVTVGALASLGGCGRGVGAGAGEPSAAARSPMAAKARAGVSDPALAQLLVEHFDAMLRWSPVRATTLGDRRFDRLLADRSDAAVRRHLAQLDGYLARAGALDAAALAPADRITLELLRDQLVGELGLEVCASHLWVLSARDNALADLATLPQDHPVDSAAAADALLARYRAIPALFATAEANLRLGAARGLVGDAESIGRTLAMLDGELGRATAEWALMVPAAKGGPAALGPGPRAAFVAELGRIVEADIRPAVVRYRGVIADELLPRGRDGARIGLAGLPEGAACYQGQIRRHTGLARTAAELHALGLAEIERLDRELTALGNQVLGRGRPLDLAGVLAALRGDPALYFTSRDEILAAAGAALDRARARMPDVVGHQPRTACRVIEIPAHEAPFTTVAYYREPHPGSGKPGEYYINTFRPEVRPRFEMEALTFHESIPGHHLQIALAQEQVALPGFRRHDGSTAFVEGWALYTERLADELGLYSRDLDRIGMLSYDAWRASRLVVDTGIHALGWTRAQAEAFMTAHTALSAENIRNEVDRYVGWPGQALAYKVGQLEIVALRRQAEAALGARFELRGFHDVVLGSGAVTLGVLRRQVEAWIAARSAERPSR